MNSSSRLRLRVKSRVELLECTAVLLASCQAATKSYSVKWENGGYGFLKQEEWVPLRLEVMTDGQTDARILHGYAAVDAWRVVDSVLIERSRWGGFAATPTIEEPPRHPVAKEIIERFGALKCATLIAPDSWLDNKLQEIYLSHRQNKRTK